jgi:hypothetical protein
MTSTAGAMRALRTTALQILAAIALTSCVNDRPVEKPVRALPATAEQCTKQGGEWSTGPWGETFCAFLYSDGGKACSGKSDCKGRCLIDAAGWRSRPEGTRVTGQCAAASVSFGCNAEVEGGKVATSYLCVD